MANKYTYSISDFPYDKVNTDRLTEEIQESDGIYIALDYINTTAAECDIWFKNILTSPEETTLSGIISNHSGEVPDFVEPPVMPDGRPFVRADTRPLNTQTYFTMVGDTASGIGDGAILKWDFSNNENEYDESSVENGVTIESGMKAKRIDLWFNDPVYLKDGTMYFFNAPFNTYVAMYITVPSGNYYPNDAGSIPASALGLPGDQMYAYATKDVFYYSYVMKHHMMGDCPMGDELNSEGCQLDPVPAGWYITGLIVSPESECFSFKGYGSFEMYRANTMVLPGGSVGGE